MNIATHVRHYLTFLGGIGTIFLGWNLLTPDQVGAANEAGAKLIEPLVIIAGLVAVTVFRLAIAWAQEVFRSGSGESTRKGPGEVPLLLIGCAAAGLLGGLPSCSPSPLLRKETQDFKTQDARVRWDLGVSGDF